MKVKLKTNITAVVYRIVEVDTLAELRNEIELFEEDACIDADSKNMPRDLELVTEYVGDIRVTDDVIIPSSIDGYLVEYTYLDEVENDKKHPLHEDCDDSDDDDTDE